MANENELFPAAQPPETATAAPAPKRRGRPPKKKLDAGTATSAAEKNIDQTELPLQAAPEKAPAPVDEVKADKSGKKEKKHLHMLYFKRMKLIQ